MRKLVLALVCSTLLGAAALSASPAQAASPVTVSITFDNQWSSQKVAAASLKAHHMAGTFYTISGWIGLPSFLTLADLQQLAADGNEIGGKTVNNPELPTKSDAEATREVCTGRNVLMDLGFTVTDFAYPFAELVPQDETIAQQCGFNSARGVGNLADHEKGGCRYPSCPYAESIPPTDPYQLLAPEDNEQTTTLQSMETAVTDAANNGGGWLPFSFHQICTTSDPGCDPVYSFSPTLFDQFLTWLQSQSNVSVRTVAQVIGGTVKPRVTAPAAPAAAIGAQALQNPALSTASTVTPTNPACWTGIGYGSNTAAYSWSATGGPSGGGASTITMTNHTSGDAKLVNTFDLGECAPTATAGHAYRFTASYSSSVPVFLSVFQRSATGIWSYLTQSPYFPASSSWSTATWLTPNVPSSVSALSFGLTIDSNGTLTTGGYSAVDIGAGPPPAAAPGVNALVNPDITQADGSGSSPYCWSPSSWGSNTPTFSWTPGTSTITMSSVSSGDAKLLIAFDNGNCTPTVLPGHHYTITVSYTSTVPLYQTVYSRSSSGSWGWWTQSPDLPASPTWTTTTFVTPAVPAGTNGLSFGLTIARVGTLSTAHYAMTDSGT